MTKLVFATGNQHKFYEASKICEKFDIELVQESVEINEIQHHDAVEITRAKVMDAFRKTHAPVVVNDSSWEIPALGGFPGGYMKDISSWLRARDFKSLMQGQQDKSIFLIDTVGFYDGTDLTIFSHKRMGKFLTELNVDPESPFDSLVQMDGEPATIAEILNKGEWDISSSELYAHWYEFAKWYSVKDKERGE